MTCSRFSMAVLALATILGAGNLHAGVDRQYLVSVTNAGGATSYTPGTTQTFTVKLTNYLLSGQSQSISYVKITLPSGFTVAGPGAITLDTLGLSKWQPPAVNGQIITL